MLESGGPPVTARVPPGVSLQANVSYGDDVRQTLDVYAPDGAEGAPVILMVHGGAWRIGDKQSRGVVENKLAHWAPRGYVFVTTNYRMLPEAGPLEQARDVARAAAFVQQHAADWGADPAKLVLMGHSAGAHLVALVAASPALAAEAGLKPWLATISLDSGTLDVAATMSARHFKLFDDAFGADPKFWQRVSPHAQLEAGAPPFLLVCSTRRADVCPQGDSFATKAKELRVRAEALQLDMSHAEINALLGTDPAYTRAVDTFLASVIPRPHVHVAGSQ
jgi:acetyl esterase/lipase